MTTSTPERIVVVGADAAGMSAAHQALRSAEAAGTQIDVVVLEKTFDTSYSACGIPYLIAGLVDAPENLIARTAEQHRAQGIDLRMGVTATGLDLATRHVETDSGGRIPFDKLVLATGAYPRIPQWALDSDSAPIGGVQPVKTLDDGRYWLDRIAPAGQDGERRAVVVGGGYIGLEMAEAMIVRGFHTTLVTRRSVMGNLDPEMRERIVAGLRAAGVHVLTDRNIDSAHTVDGHVVSVTTDDGTTHPADLVVVGIGVRPASDLGSQAGLPIGAHGGYLTDAEQHLGDGVWAAGDCCEVLDRLTGKSVFAPLGTHANKQGRICGHNLIGEHRTFSGILGTAITRFSAARRAPRNCAYRAQHGTGDRGRLRCRLARHRERHGEWIYARRFRHRDERDRRPCDPSVARHADRRRSQLGQANRHRSGGTVG